MEQIIRDAPLFFGRGYEKFPSKSNFFSAIFPIQTNVFQESVAANNFLALLLAGFVTLALPICGRVDLLSVQLPHVSLDVIYLAATLA